MIKVNPPWVLQYQELLLYSFKWNHLKKFVVLHAQLGQEKNRTSEIRRRQFWVLDGVFCSQVDYQLIKKQTNMYNRWIISWYWKESQSQCYSGSVMHISTFSITRNILYRKHKGPVVESVQTYAVEQPAHFQHLLTISMSLMWLFVNLMCKSKNPAWLRSLTQPSCQNNSCL